MKAVGIHVFAGGFTRGFQQVMEVPLQLETHGFGIETAAQLTEVVNAPVEDWWAPDDCRVCFGNPRCTGFSTITSGYDGSCHGPWAKQTQDIHDLIDFSIDKFDVICWESVQQAYSVGRPLLTFLSEKLQKRRYRVAHVMLSAASCGGFQHRKRYFFIAYRDCFKFNVEPPDIPEYAPTVYDAIFDMRNRETRPFKLKNTDYDPDCYLDLTPGEWETVPRLPNGWNLNMMGRLAFKLLSKKQQITYKWRNSNMPFSMHGIVRLQWLVPFPTIHSSAGRWIHPWLHRPVTIRELCAAMGWDFFPRGRNPVAQIAKGVVPAAGEWIARQIEHCLNDTWGNDDWESSYDDRSQTWQGRDTSGEQEKFFDLTRYVNSRADIEDRKRYPEAVQQPRYIWDGKQFHDRGWDVA